MCFISEYIYWDKIGECTYWAKVKFAGEIIKMHASKVKEKSKRVKFLISTYSNLLLNKKFEHSVLSLKKNPCFIKNFQAFNFH